MASVFRLAVGALGSALRQATSLTSVTSTSTSSISTSSSRLLSAASAPRLRALQVTSPVSPPQRTIITSTTTTCRLFITTSGIGSSPSSSSLLSLRSSSSRNLLQRPQGWVLGTTQSSVRGYHVRVALKRRCSGCYFVRRKGRLYVECKTKPRHKQMQVMSKRKTWKEDYSKGFIQRAVHWKYDRDHRYYKLGDTEFAKHDWLKGKIGVTV